MIAYALVRLASPILAELDAVRQGIEQAARNLDKSWSITP